jgi:cytochrome c551/c552
MAEEMTQGRNPGMRKVWYCVIGVVLVGTLFWALRSTGYVLSPQKRYKKEFAYRFGLYLNKIQVRSTGAENKIKDDPEYQKLNATYKQLLQQEEAQTKELRAKLDDVNKKLAPVRTIFLNIRDPDHWHLSYQDAEDEYYRLKQQSDDLTQQLDAQMQPSRDALEAANTFIAAKMADLAPQQLDKLRKKYVDGISSLDDLQISVPDVNLVDKCQTCHIGVSVTGLELTPASMSLPGEKPDKYARAFMTHPKPELLRIHNPAKFGCTLCHGGNGRETSSVEAAHGNTSNWSKPLYSKVYMEAGCQTCHRADMVLAGKTELAETLDRSKDIYRQGCMGCHRYPGFNDERGELKSVAEQIVALQRQKENNLRQVTLKQAKADISLREEDARRLRQEVKNLGSEDSQIGVQIEQLEERTRDLMREEKKVGHNLKEIRQKTYAGWIPFLILGPGRPLGPTIPTDEQILSMATYLWQTAIQDPVAKQEPGDPVRGRELLQTRGCLGCHPIAVDPMIPVHTVPSTLSLIGAGQIMGGTFAIPLSRVGERDKYDYLVRWINNPRQRLRPYCPREKKDIGAEDYAKHGLPFRFDREHDRCPNDGEIMQVQQKMVMPNLRLTLEESRDIASYLISLKAREPESFPVAPNDPKLMAEGKANITRYGCSGCHEIAGFETQELIGPELTYEGSKSVEQLDFGHLRHMAQSGQEPMITHEDRERLPEGLPKGSWYTLKGFLEHKVAEPNIFDLSTASIPERARMPNGRLTSFQLQAVTTLLLGSQKTDLPQSYMYKPDDARGDIQRGWWVIRKYNCMGCHQLLPGQTTSLMNVPHFREHPEQLPPTLVMEGARVNPEWLAGFLRNPALSDTDTHRNGVRQYLPVRMPTFSFSDNEIRILVRFFQAMAHQPTMSIPEPVETLTPKENKIARTLMSSACGTCHATGDPAHDKSATAPNFLLTQSRLNPGWVERWIVDPQTIMPGTSMPNGLFRKENGHWVVNGPMPTALKNYDQDQVDLLVRYVFQLTPKEQQKLSSSAPARNRQRQQVQARMASQQGSR